MKKIITSIIAMMVCLTLLPISYQADETDVRTINLSSVKEADGNYSFKATIDNQDILEYDYTWHVDPSSAHKDVKNSPAEYYTGTKPENETIYIAHDIYYYPELDTTKFKRVNYDGEYEWVYYYDCEEYADYIFSTLPSFNTNTLPTEMMHSEEEAFNNAVLHINEAGTYKLTGYWHGQVYIDLGDDAFEDETAVVTLILDNVDIECSVASGVVFYQCYEVDNKWEDREVAIKTVDTSKAGANVIIADGSTNSVSGTNIFRILKTKYKDENSTDEIKTQKKSIKVDAAFYSYVSMNVDGDSGILNINSTFEGLDSELHLTINGGNINITSGDDGINVNEDNVSILTINGGNLQIMAGTGYEGDGIDSNGYIVINDGTVIASARPQADSGLDSDCGTYINGGMVIAVGSSMDVVSEYSEDANQVTCNLVFSTQQQLNDIIAIKDADGKYIFAYDGSLNEFMASYNRTYQCLIISTAKLTVGEEYEIYTSGTIKGSQVNGLYSNISSIKNNKQLAYSSTGTNNRGGGNFNPFDQQGGQQQPTQPQGDTKPQGGTIPTQPQGDQQQGQPQGDQQQGQQQQAGIPSGLQGDTFNPFQTASSTSFKMEDKVNTFSNITYVSDTNTTSTPSDFLYILASIGIFAIGVAVGILTTLLIKKKKLEKSL